MHSNAVSIPPPTIFITGFPGFIGRRLIRTLALGDPEATFITLVEPRQVDAAERAVEDLAEDISNIGARFEIVLGDITQRRFGLDEDDHRALTGKTTHIWHLAALYDLAVAERLAYRVNVLGTINVLDFAEACQGLQRLHYVSTCYVSGDRDGLVREVELDEGQGFKNHYESTKFWAEVEVQRRWEHIPTVIFRPGVVVGDSHTGGTNKYDGPYHVIRLLRRLPAGLPFPNVGKGDCVVNIIPIDFAVASMVTIGNLEEVDGQAFHIADPNPMRAADIVALMLDIMGKAPSIGSIPSGLASLALRLRPLESALDLPRESLAYFNHGARYDTANTSDALAQTSLRCPHLSTYLDTLIHYVELHPNRPVG
jgi:thioester reductase-like protein